MTGQQEQAHARILQWAEQQGRLMTHIQAPWERPEKKVSVVKCKVNGRKGKDAAMKIPEFRRIK